MLWCVDYVVGNTYKAKYVQADTAAQAIKRARVKNIVDLNPARTETKEQTIEQSAREGANT